MLKSVACRVTGQLRNIARYKLIFANGTNLYHSRANGNPVKQRVAQRATQYPLDSHFRGSGTGGMPWPMEHVLYWTLIPAYDLQGMLKRQ